MAAIKNILFPVDFSPTCVAMGAYVKRAAAMFGARVSLIHVVDLASHNGFELYLRSINEISEDHQIIGKEKLNSFLTAQFPIDQCPRILVSGDPASQIARVAKEGLFDLIVMPTHAGLFRQMLLGSTTAKVLNDADCPVLTSRHAQDMSPRPLEKREWLCAIGLSSDSQRVLRFANQAAVDVQARLTIIHAIDAKVEKQPIALHLEEKLESVERTKAGNAIADLQQAVGSSASVRIALGPIKDALLEVARLSDADVLMIGRRPRSGSRGRMRDLTYAMIRDSPFPVLSI